MAPPVTVPEHEEQLVLAARDGGERERLVAQTPVPPVEVRFAVAMIGPVIES